MSSPHGPREGARVMHRYRTRRGGSDTSSEHGCPELQTFKPRDFYPLMTDIGLPDVKGNGNCSVPTVPLVDHFGRGHFVP